MRYGRIAWAIPVLSLLAAPAGESLYLSQCAVCHGERGEGGRGPSLAKPALRNAPDDEALFRVIRRGIPNSGMPATALADREIHLVLSHVRALGRVAATPALPGNPRRGEQIFLGKGGCAGCHEAVGPDLAGIGARRSAAHLRTSLTDPAADLPAGFVLIEVVTKDGRKVTGSRVNEDTFSLQLRDSGGAVRSFWKAELREWKRQTGRSPMPSYKRVLSEAELDDVTAFLAGWQEASR
jgi:putative heme-binding domain-containing protein